MKKLITLLFSAGLLFAAFAGDEERQALYGALDQVEPSVKACAAFKNNSVAILPIDNDSEGIIAGRLKNILTRAGISCVEASRDPMWNEIIREIAWAERKSDILDSKSIAGFGKLKGVQILLYGKLRNLKKYENRVYAEIELHACNINTREHIWGDSFVKHVYTGKDMIGIISLDIELKRLLKKNFASALSTLQAPLTAGKLNGITTVAVAPLVGDIDNYITSLAVEMLTKTKLIPKNRGISLPLLRSSARDGKVDSDAILYGAVRDLTRYSTVVSYSGEKVISSYNVSVDIQLFLEDINSGNILWSSTIPLVETIRSERNMTEAELKAKREQNEKEAERIRLKQEALRKQQAKEAEALRKKKAKEAEALRIKREREAEALRIKQEKEAEALRIKQEKEEKRQYEKRMRERKDKADNAGEIIKADLVDNWHKYLKVIGIIVGVIIALAIIFAAVKAYFSYNNVR